jgi:hypothetical protein
LHQLDEPFALDGAQQVRHRHAHVVEEEFGRILRLVTDLLEVPSTLEAFALAFDQDQADALGLLVRVGFRNHNDKVGQLSIADKGFLPIEDIVVAVAYRTGADALQVRSGTGLGHGDGADRFASDHLRQPVLFLILGAIVLDIGGDDVRMQIEGGAGRAGAGEFLDHDGAEPEIRFGTAVCFRHCAAEQPRVAGFAPYLAADHAVALPLVMMRGDFGLDEGAHRLAEQFMLARIQGPWDHAGPSYGLNIFIRSVAV